jgi:hypothetical protein
LERFNLNFFVYFDESNKIDQFNKEFSYYGAYAGTGDSIGNISNKVQDIYEECGSSTELHFREYNQDTNLKKYLKTLHTVINEDISVNLLIVNNADALSAAEKIDLSPQELRNLFYIKR